MGRSLIISAHLSPGKDNKTYNRYCPVERSLSELSRCIKLCKMLHFYLLLFITKLKQQVQLHFILSNCTNRVTLLRIKVNHKLNHLISKVICGNHLISKREVGIKSNIEQPGA